MIRTLTCLAAAFFLVAAPAHAQQASRLDEIIKRGSLRGAIYNDRTVFPSGFKPEAAGMLATAANRRLPTSHRANSRYAAWLSAALFLRKVSVSRRSAIVS